MSVASTARLRGQRIILASGTGIALRITQILASMITLPILLHHLGLAGFGIWSAATSLAFLSAMLDLGLGSALVTLIPQAMRGTNPVAARELTTAALWGGCGLSRVVAICVVLVGMQTGFHPSTPFVIAGFAVALNIPLSIGNEIWMGLQKAYVASGWQVVANIVNNALLLAGAFAGWGVTALSFTVFSVLLMTNGAILMHVLAAHPGLRPQWRVTVGAFRQVSRQGGQMFIITIASLCAFGFDNVLTLHWLGADAAARMSIGLRICTTATGMIGIATQPFWPGFSDALAAGDIRWLRWTLIFGSLATLAMSVIGSAIIIRYGAPLLQLWLHQDLHFSSWFFWTMSAWIIVGTLPHIPGLLLHAALRLRPQIYILSLAAAIGLLLKYFAAGWFGVIGILAVTPVMGLVLIVPGYLLLAWQVMAGFSESKR
jgi:O-antigen/teichoic acid export membrane protein